MMVDFVIKPYVTQSKGDHMNLKTKLETVSKPDMDRIHEESLRILWETGVVFHNEEALGIFKRHGFKINEKTVHLTKKEVEDALDLCPATFRWQGRNESNTITLGKGYHVQPPAGCIYIQDLDLGRRLGTMQDYVNLQKIYQKSSVVHITGGLPMDPSDIPVEHRPLQMMYQALKHTDKPLLGTIAPTKMTRKTLDMVQVALGEKAFGPGRHSIAVSANPLSPLAYSDETLSTMIEYAKRHQPVLITPCALSGITAPMSLLGSAVLQNVEILAGIVLMQTIAPGVPVVYAPVGSVGNMKTGGYIGSPPEQFLINSTNLQLALDLYHLPTRSMCGMTESKLVDCQAGYETMQNLMLGMLSGAHIIHECVGILDSIMTVSYEKTMIDQELLQRLFCFTSGITDISDEALAGDIIQEVGHNGTYLTHPTTFRHVRERWQPTVSNWDTYDMWEKKGSPDVSVTANKQWKEALQDCPDSLIDPELDHELMRFLSGCGIQSSTPMQICN